MGRYSGALVSTVEGVVVPPTRHQVLVTALLCDATALHVKYFFALRQVLRKKKQVQMSW